MHADTYMCMHSRKCTKHPPPATHTYIYTLQTHTHACISLCTHVPLDETRMFQPEDILISFHAVWNIFYNHMSFLTRLGESSQAERHLKISKPPDKLWSVLTNLCSPAKREKLSPQAFGLGKLPGRLLTSRRESALSAIYREIYTSLNFNLYQANI